MYLAFKIIFLNSTCMIIILIFHFLSCIWCHNLKHGISNNNQTGLENLEPQQWVSETFCLFRQDSVFLTKRDKPMIIIMSSHS